MFVAPLTMHAQAVPTEYDSTQDAYLAALNQLIDLLKAQLADLIAQRDVESAEQEVGVPTGTEEETPSEEAPGEEGEEETPSEEAPKKLNEKCTYKYCPVHP